MTCARFAVVATLGASLAGPSLLAQTPKAPEMHPILAGRKIEQPLKGQADVEFVASSKRVRDDVITTMRVKNMSAEPIEKLKVEETWFDKGGKPVGGSEGILEKRLEPGAVETLTITTPWNAKMNGNSWNFSHANGTVKPKKVARVVEDTPKTAEKK